MAVIGNFPRGLVSLTGLRDMGEAPRELAQSIAPTIDVTEFLLLNRQTEKTSGTATAVGFVSGPTVPAGELWYLHAFSVICGPLAATERIRFTVGAIIDNEFFAFGAHSITANTTGDRASSFINRPIWVGPGVTLAVFVESYSSAGGIGLGINASVTKLRI